MQGSPDASRQFFARYWPEARAVSDEDRSFYTAFSLKLWGLGPFVHRGVWWRSARILMKGYFTGRPHGDVRQMPGMYLVRDGRILWQHESRHIADRPDYRLLARYLRTALGGSD